MRDQEKYPKILISRRRGGLFKHQNNSFFDLERHHLVCSARVAIAPFLLVPQPLRLNRGGESPVSTFPINRNSQDESYLNVNSQIKDQAITPKAELVIRS